jgi:hypothetical protein
LNASRALYRVQNNIDASLRDLSEQRMACLQALGQERESDAVSND